MLGLAFLLAVFPPLARSQDSIPSANPSFTPGGCYAIAGVQFSRLIWERDTQRIRNDGHTVASAGALCPVLSGKRLSLDAGASVGALADSSIWQTPQTVLAVNIGMDVDGLITLGLAPHWVMGMSPADSASYGLGVFASFRPGAWMDAFMGDVANGARE